MGVFDFKKQYSELYLPGGKPAVVCVPAITFAAVDGKGDPNQADGTYSRAVGLLYTVAYTIKMSKMGGRTPPGYFDYVMPPLEGLWQMDDGGEVDLSAKHRFCWTSMIRLPDFVTPEVFTETCAEVQKKKKLDTASLRYLLFDEGLCVQCMHTSPYDDEPATVELLNRYTDENGYAVDFGPERRHHEIYLGDPRKTAPAKMRTVLRHPVRER